MQVHGVICNIASPAGCLTDVALIRGVKRVDQWNWWKLITMYTVKFSMLMMIFAPRDLQFRLDKVSYFAAGLQQTWQLLPSLSLCDCLLLSCLKLTTGQVNSASYLKNAGIASALCTGASGKKKNKEAADATVEKREREKRSLKRIHSAGPPVTVTNVEERTRHLAQLAFPWQMGWLRVCEFLKNILKKREMNPSDRVTCGTVKRRTSWRFSREKSKYVRREGKFTWITTSRKVNTFTR